VDDTKCFIQYYCYECGSSWKDDLPEQVLANTLPVDACPNCCMAGKTVTTPDLGVCAVWQTQNDYLGVSWLHKGHLYWEESIPIPEENLAIFVAAKFPRNVGFIPRYIYNYESRQFHDPLTGSRIVVE
jgi:hypothetical protein